MKTAYELAKEELKDFTDYPTGAKIVQLMLKYGESLANEFSNWLCDMDRIKLTNQLPPFETPEMITEYFLKAKVRIQSVAPIPLNNAVRFKLGLDKANSIAINDGLFIALDQDGDEFNVFIHQMNTEGGEDVILLPNPIKYAHQFKSIYSALSGTELDAR